jgi:hypothetical protein
MSATTTTRAERRPVCWEEALANSDKGFSGVDNVTLNLSATIDVFQIAQGTTRVQIPAAHGSVLPPEMTQAADARRFTARS